MRLNRQFIRTQLMAQNILSKNAPAKRENLTESTAAVLKRHTAGLSRDLQL